MNPTDLRKMIAQGEGVALELKTGHASSSSIANVMREVVAMLNHGGGHVLLGLADDGRVLGVPDAVSAAEQLQRQLGALITPRAPWAIETATLDAKDIIVIDVPEGADKPYVGEGAIYLRRGNRSVAASRDEISALIRQRAAAADRWERQIALGASRGELDEGLVRQTLARASASGHWPGDADDVNGFLHGLGLTEGDNVTHAAWLLYGKKPARLLPQARVRLLVLPEGKTGGHYALDKTFDTCLLKMAQALPAALAPYAEGVRSEFDPRDWQRNDRRRYPPAALREGVMNALVHRDYASSASIVISVMPDSIQIVSPGGLPDDMTVAELRRGQLSLPRNPDIAHVCFLHGLIEKLGRGTQMIMEECRRAKLKEPRWNSSSRETALALFSPEAEPEAVELSERQQRILKFLSTQPSAKAAEIAQALGEEVTERTVRNDLLALVDKHLVKRVGQGPSTRYALAEPEQPPNS